MSTILKITHINDNKVCLQNESKSIDLLQPKCDKTRKLLGDKPHVFVKAKICKTKSVEILTAVKNQGW